jgi:cell cycle arrest protein BUB3
MADTRPPPEAQVLPDTPTDGITGLQYLHDTTKPLLGCTSWDGSLRVYDTAAKSRQFSHQMESGPLLSLAILGNDGNRDTVVTGGMDGSIRMVDLQQTSSAPQIVGHHESSSSGPASGEDSKASAACSCLGSLAPESSPELIVSAGWHKKLHVWDIRQHSPSATIDLPGKAFAMHIDHKHSRIVVGTSGRRTCFIDLRSGKGAAEMVLDRESSLKYQTRSLRFFPDGEAIVVGSVEGRVAVEYLDELGLPAKGKKYAFKCHRSGDIVYPVNVIEFHPRFGTFATGGCDGGVGTWLVLQM